MLLIRSGEHEDVSNHVDCSFEALKDPSHLFSEELGGWRDSEREPSEATPAKRDYKRGKLLRVFGQLHQVKTGRSAQLLEHRCAGQESQI